ncbi:MAG: hypothetical protein HYV35_01190 [Lentisphaerae bacterium]|nr:hypothetical protein [Lentisphaerota bacterium]
MNPLYQAAKEVSDFMQERQWKFCVIGGLAVQRWGEPRTTLDVDITLLTGFGEEESYAVPLLESFKARIPEALPFALRNRVLLLTTSNGRDVDVSFGALPFEYEMMARAAPFEFMPGVTLTTCMAEDLLIMKAFAARTRDWLDVEGIIVRRQGHLDIRYILKHLTLLCELKETPEILAKVRKLLGAE